MSAECKMWILLYCLGLAYGIWLLPERKIISILCCSFHSNSSEPLCPPSEMKEIKFLQWNPQDYMINLATILWSIYSQSHHKSFCRTEDKATQDFYMVSFSPVSWAATGTTWNVLSFISPDAKYSLWHIHYIVSFGKKRLFAFFFDCDWFLIYQF